MAKPKLIKPQYPPVDWLMAAILERKRVMKLDWADIGNAIGMTGDAARKMVSTKAPADWPRDVRESICKLLGIDVITFVVGSPEDPTR